MINRFSHASGQSLVEILIAIAIASILLPALITAFVASREGGAQEKQRLSAITLVQEAQEAIRSVRERGWATFAVNGTYYPNVSGSLWSLQNGSQTINGFTRQILIEDVSRENGQIVLTGGTVDPSTKKVTIQVSWTEPISDSITTSSYLTRYLENEAFEETTQTEFNAGEHTGTTVQATTGSTIPDDGEIILGAGGEGSWCGPNVTEITQDLPRNGVANAVAAIEGKVFAATGENASGVSFASVDISNDNPPQTSISGTFDNYKTNGVFGEEDYAYIGTDTNSEEVVIIDLNTNPPSKVAGINVPGNTSATSVFVKDNILYTTANTNRLYTYNISNKSSPQILDSDGINLTASGYKVVVVGDYAYVATGNSSRDMVVINVSNPSNMTFVGGTITNATVARDLAVNTTGTRVYLATDSSSAFEQNEFFIIDVSNKAQSSFPIIGGYNTGYLNVKGVTVVPGNIAIIVGDEYGGNEVDEYQVLNISTESNPQSCGGANVESPIRGIASVLESDGDAYSYIIIGADPELRVIEGGPGGAYATEGTFESQIFDPGFTTAFNRLVMNFEEPSGTSTQLQVAIADQVNNTCADATYAYVGPDGTSGTFFEDTTGVLPFNNDGIGYENPARCMRYKVYLDTPNSNTSPNFFDVSINYSP